MSALVSAILIAGGVGLIQYHSIAFWSDHVSREIGWAWSLSIEAAGLWLWYRPGLPSRMLGLVASVLLLAGPLYQIATPALASRAQAEATSQVSAQAARRLRNELSQDAQLVRTYAHNSQSRKGWLQPIQKLQERMDVARSKLNALGSTQAKSRVNTTIGVYALVLLQALGLILIQTTNVLAITHISGLRRECTTAAQRVRNPRPESIEEAEADAAPRGVAQDEYGRLRSLADQVRGFIEEGGLSIAKAAERLGVDRRDLSYLLNWSGPGDRKPAAAVLRKLEAVK